jgi:hypothetical protein
VKNDMPRVIKPVSVWLSAEERKALFDMATAELRMPDRQLRHLLRQEMQRRGYVLPTAAQIENLEETLQHAKT